MIKVQYNTSRETWGNLRVDGKMVLKIAIRKSSGPCVFWVIYQIAAVVGFLAGFPMFQHKLFSQNTHYQHPPCCFC